MDYLRDFFYLDIAKLYSFVSQIQGGMINEIIETTKRLGGLSAGVNVGIPQLGAKADATKHKESEQQQTITLTDPAYFGVLHQYLKKENKLTDITEMSSENISHLPVGQFVEMHGIAEPPLVEDWIRRLNALFSFLEGNIKTFNRLQGNPKSKSSTKFSNMNMRQFREVIDLLIDYINFTRKDPDKQFITIAPDSQSFKVWCGLLPNYSLVPLHSILPSRVWVFGRIDHYIEDGNPEKIVDLTMFNQATQVDDLLKALNAINTLTGQNPIRETDFQAKFPDFFIVPVAMYK